MRPQRQTVRNPWVVLASTSLAVFAVFLDTTILFVAFPSISARVLLDCAVVAVVDPQRLHDRVRRAADPRRPTGGSSRTPPNVPDRRGRCSPSRRCCAASRRRCPSWSLRASCRPSPRQHWCPRRWRSCCRRSLVTRSRSRSRSGVRSAPSPAPPARRWARCVIENLGWRWAFYINLPVGIVSFFLGRRVLPEWRESNPGRLPDPAGVVLLAAGLALAAFGIVQTDEWGWASTRFVVCEARRGRADRAVRAALQQELPIPCST